MIETLAVIAVIVLIFLPSIVAVIRGCKYFIFVQVLMIFAIFSNSGDFSIGLWVIALIVSLYKTQTPVKGDRGDVGMTGPTGWKGENGYSAYEIWLQLGNEGSKQDFINDIKKGA